MVEQAAERGFEVVDFNEIEGVSCPCGSARRAFADVGANVATTWFSNQPGADEVASYVRGRGGAAVHFLLLAPKNTELEEKRLSL